MDGEGEGEESSSRRYEDPADRREAVVGWFIEPARGG
jgi:hypothetical protein